MKIQKKGIIERLESLIGSLFLTIILLIFIIIVACLIFVSIEAILNNPISVAIICITIYLILTK